MSGPENLTVVLNRARTGDEKANGELWGAVYDELKVIAHRQIVKSRPGETLCTTALVNEAYVKVMKGNSPDYKDRNHFYAIACTAMRQILVDYVRHRSTQKRKAQNEAIPLDDVLNLGDMPDERLLALDEALQALEKKDPQMGKIIEFYYFGGFSIKETAGMMDVSESTIERKMKRARLYLFDYIS